MKIKGNINAGYNNSIDGSTKSSIIGGNNNIIKGSRSVILGGQSITGTTDDTVYVPHLNINDVDSLSLTTSANTYNNLTTLSDGTVVENNLFYIGVNFETTGVTWNYVAGEQFSVLSVDNPFGLTYTILQNGSAYTLGTTILLYDTLSISGVSSTGYLKLNCKA